MLEELSGKSQNKLNDFFASFRAGVEPILLLDYDGTLAPFRVDRFQARPWMGVREILTAIRKQGRTRMAVVTGRPAQEIAPLLGLDPPLEVYGLHGAEHLTVDGRHELEEASPEVCAKLEELRALLRHDSFGGLFEDKPNAVVMHWRGLSPAKARIVSERTRQLFEPAACIPGLSLLNFEAGVELRAGRNKGGAVEVILATASADAPVAYLGDDLTDEAAFIAVNRSTHPRLSVLVRREWRETEASVWLQPPVALKEFLERWRAACEAINSRPAPVEKSRSQSNQASSNRDSSSESRYSAA